MVQLLETSRQTESFNPQDYLSAIGAALEGLDTAPVRFDLLHSQKKQHHTTYKFPWKVMIGMTVMALMASVVLWGMQLHHKQKQLNELRRQITQTQPELIRLQQLRADWNLLARYLPTAGQAAAGNRI